MKKKFVTVVSLLAVVMAMLMLFSACSTYGKVKSTFEKAGYEVTDVSEERKTQLADLIGKENVDRADIHTFTKGLNYAVVLEYNNSEQLVKALKDVVEFKEFGVTEDDGKAAYDKLQKSDKVNGNCVVLFASIDGYSVFKSSK